MMLRRTAILAALALTARGALGHGMFPSDVPVERLIANTEAFIKEHPDNAEAYYRLGRIHTLALETQTEFARAYDEGRGTKDLPRIAEGAFAKTRFQDDKRPASTPEQLRAHLSAAIKNLERAIAMKPREARYRLTLACALEAGKSMRADVTVWPLVPGHAEEGERREWIEQRVDELLKSAPSDEKAMGELMGLLRGVTEWGGAAGARDVIVRGAQSRAANAEFKALAEKLRLADWENQIADQYFLAMSIALPDEATATSRPIWGGMEDWVAYEAGSNFVRYAQTLGDRPENQIRLKVARATVKAFDELPPPNAITPIIVALDGQSLRSLTTSATTGFDLDGSGRAARWSWITPDAGLLVWDPTGEGKITSGRQLFGSVSWQLNFASGYEALDALDDDRDHALRGKELAGLALWFDRNSNGVSDAGEVAPLARFGIESLATVFTAFEGDSPVNARGVTLAGGRRVPSYDWISARDAGSECGAAVRVVLSEGR